MIELILSSAILTSDFSDYANAVALCQFFKLQKSIPTVVIVAVDNAHSGPVECLQKAEQGFASATCLEIPSLQNTDTETCH